MNKSTKILLPAIMAVIFICGMFMGRFFNKADKKNSYTIQPRTDKLSYVLSYITSEYVDKVDKSEIIEQTIPKILNDLDPHSVYIPASDFQELNEPLEGNFSGIGVQFNILNDTLMVIKSVQNGPSEKLGILPGDRFITVDGDTVAGVKMPSDSIVKKLRGPRGTQVEVGVLRKSVDDLVMFNITRDNIPLYSVDVAYMINNNTGLIKISRFAKTTYEEFNQAVIKLFGKGMEKLVLDLRGNGGGLLSTAVGISDHFLEENQTIVYTEGHARKRFDYNASKGGLCTEIDVIVLIDETSASASEIVAGAIQDNDRGIVIGRRSFGKGLVQEQQLMSDGSAIRLTISRYHTPTGRCIQKSYQNGSDEYHHELSERFNNGELYELDSSYFADSLKFTTPGGRTVYGGGGIMPDIFVPIDTSDVSNYLFSVRNRGLIYRYALEFSDQYRDKLTSFTSIPEIVEYLENENTLESFIKYAAKNGVPEKRKEINESKEILETQLFAFIVRNIYDNEGFYPIIEKIDNTLQRALKALDEGLLN